MNTTDMYWILRERGRIECRIYVRIARTSLKCVYTATANAWQGRTKIGEDGVEYDVSWKNFVLI